MTRRAGTTTAPGSATTVAWVLLAPFLVGVVLLLAVPAVLNLGYAFTDHTGFGSPTFTGLDNVRRLLRDPLFTASLRASLLFAVMAVPLRMLAATAMGIALARRHRGARWQRVLVYLPTVLPDVTLSLAFLYLLNPLHGPVNGLLGLLGLPEPLWLSTTWGARWAIVLMMLFPVGEAFLVVLAGRRGLPGELHEAAAVDGASPWQALTRVTLPAMFPLLVLLTARDLILTLQVTFVPAYLLTDGGPRAATLFLPVHVFDQAFEFLGFGYGAMLTLVLLAVTTTLVGVTVWLGWRWYGRG